MTAPHFSPRVLSFLRALKRHSDRDWFKARKEEAWSPDGVRLLYTATGKDSMTTLWKS